MKGRKPTPCTMPRTEISLRSWVGVLMAWRSLSLDGGSALVRWREPLRRSFASIYSSSRSPCSLWPVRTTACSLTTPGPTSPLSSNTSGSQATAQPPRPRSPQASRRTTVSSRFHLLIDLIYQRLYQLHGLFHRRAHRLAQLHNHVVVVLSAHDHLRLAANDEGAGRSGAQSAGEFDHLDGVHPVGIQHRLPPLLDLRLDEVDRTRPLTPRGGVDEDGGLVIALQRVGEIHPSYTEVHHLHSLRQPAAGEPTAHLDPETVVAQEHVADAGDQDAPTHE